MFTVNLPKAQNNPPERKEKMPGRLFVVGTPIGNLGDFSPRAFETLNACDFIAAEDTRVTLKLLNHFGIKKHLVSCHEHNEKEKSFDIIERILGGENCALVSDAGMPCVSDPGSELINKCHERGIEVAAVPGPTAFATAFALSGLMCKRFTFEGFLSTAKRSRREHLESIKHETRAMIFYEAPHKLVYTLRDMLEYLGDRRLTIAREITKIHEQTIRTTLSEAVKHYEENTPKGEFVLIIEGEQPEKEQSMSLEEAVEYARELQKDGMPKTAAAKEAANFSGQKKSEIYKKLTEE